MHWWRNQLGALWQDSRYALRWFRRELILTGAIVATLGFGIGLNTGVFSVLSGMVFRSRVEKDPSTFFQVLLSPSSQPDSAPRLFSASTAELRRFRSAPGVSSTGAWTVSSGRLEDDPDASLLMLVNCEFFDVYGLGQPRLGRVFQQSECDNPGTVPNVLLGEELWRDRFHSDPQTVGRAIPINGTPYRVVGILPAGFPGRLRGPGIWIPYSQQAAFYGGLDLFREDSRPWLTVEGRLRSDYSRVSATRELTALVPGRNLTLTDGSLIQDPANRVVAASISVLLTGALSLIVLMACTNVTMLLLSRAVSRRYEMSVRLSLGASRRRLLRMSATEGILLALVSAVPSAVIAGVVPAILRSLVPRMPHYPMHTDWIVFSYMIGITLLAGGIAAMVPAAESLRANLNGSLRGQESVFSTGRKRWRLREMLVAAQVAMSLVLVIGASLFARTQHRLFAADPGFDSGHIVLAPLSAKAGPTREMEANFGSIAGVRTVAFMTSVFWSRSEGVSLHTSGAAPANAALTAVSPNLFETLGVPLVRGVPLDPAAPNRVIVTEATAQLLWRGRDPLKQTFATADGVQWEVAGIVRESILDRRSPVPRIFRVSGDSAANMTAVIHCDGDPATISRAVTSALDSVSSEVRQLPRTLDSDIAEMGSRFRVVSGFASFFGVAAFFLAIIGVSGIMSFAVSRRTKEMGIRLALGATRGDIVREVLRSGMRPVVVGLIAGLPIAALFSLGLVQAFRNTPTPFEARDPLAFGAIPVVLILGALGAMLRPALRACSANPASSLRQD